MSSWTELLQELQEGHAEFEGHPYGGVFSSLRLTVDRLDEALRQRYLELAVFSEDEPIPIATVERLWMETGELKQSEVEGTLHRLQDLGLLYVTETAEGGYLGLHDIQLDFIRLEVEDLEKLNRVFLDAFRSTLTSRGGRKGPAWSTLPVTETYLWAHLADHLTAAGRTGELVRLVKDADYLTQRNLLYGPAAVERDLQAARSVVPADPELRVLQESIVAVSQWLWLDRGALPGLLHDQLRSIGWAEARIAAAFGASARQLVLSLRHPLQKTGGELRTFLGHTDRVHRCVITSDGKHLVSASHDRSLRVWDLSTGECLHTLEGHEDYVSECALALGGSRVVSAGGDGTVRVWDVETGESLHILGRAWVREDPTDLDQGGSPRRFQITPDGRRVLFTETSEAESRAPMELGPESYSRTGLLEVWDIETAERVGTFGACDAWLLNPAGNTVIVVEGGKLWERAIESGERLRSFSFAEKSEIRRLLNISRDGRYLVYTSGDGLTVLDLEDSRTSPRVIDEGRLGWLGGSWIGPDCRSLVLVFGRFDLLESGASFLGVFDLATGAHRLGYSPLRHRFVIDVGQPMVVAEETGELVELDPLGHQGPVPSVCFHEAEGWFASASADQTIKLWDLRSGECLRTIQTAGGVEDCALTPDGLTLISAETDSSLRAWDVGPTSSESRDSGVQEKEGLHHSGRILACGITPDGRTAITGSVDKTVKVWSLATGRLLATLEGHEQPAKGLTTIEGGQRIVSSSPDSTVKVWDTATAECSTTVDLSRRGLRSGVNWLAGGVVLYALGFFIWGAEWGCLEPFAFFALLVGWLALLSLIQPWVPSSSLDTADGRVLVGLEKGRVLFVDLEAGEVTRVLGKRRVKGEPRGPRSRAVNACLNLPGERGVVAASDDHTLKIWEWGSGKLRSILHGHEGPVRACALTADGRYLVSGSDDRTLRVWDSTSGQLMRTLEGHTGPVNDCASTAEGNLVVSASEDNTLRVWDPVEGRLLGTLYGKAPFTSVAVELDSVCAGDTKGNLWILQLALPD